MTEEEYEQYLEDTKFEARFDVSTLKAIVSEGCEKHQAYGMMFSEYRQKRLQFINTDDSEKKRLSFCMPAFLACMSNDLALCHDTSYHRFTNLVVELGLIHFHVDYHDDYALAIEGKKFIHKHVRNEDGKSLYMQLEKQTIALGSNSGEYSKAKHFSSSVPEWLYRAITEAAKTMNTSVSDFVFLCWCMGIKNCFPQDSLSPLVEKDVDKVCRQFEREAKHYTDRLEAVLMELEKLKK